MNDQFSYSNHFLQESSKTFVPIVKNLKAFLSYHIHTNELNKHEVMVTLNFHLWTPTSNKFNLEVRCRPADGEAQSLMLSVAQIQNNKKLWTCSIITINWEEVRRWQMYADLCLLYSLKVVFSLLCNSQKKRFLHQHSGNMAITWWNYNVVSLCRINREKTCSSVCRQTMPVRLESSQRPGWLQHHVRANVPPVTNDTAFRAHY